MTGKLTTFTPEVIASLFGTEAAENEKSERFQQYSMRGRTFEEVHNSLPLRVVVGYKGSGKSAIMRIAYNEDQKISHYPIWLTPSSIRSFEAIGASGLSLANRVNLWASSLIYSIAREVCIRYLDVNSAAITDASFNEIPTDNDSILDAVQKIVLSAKGFKLREIHRYQLTVYIDDVDLGWNGSTDHIQFISALLNSLRILSRANQTIRFRVGLRSDVYFLVRTSDESTDKFQESVVWLDWSNHEILALLVKRIESFRV